MGLFDLFRKRPVTVEDHRIEQLQSQIDELQDLKLTIQTKDPKGKPVEESVKKRRRQAPAVAFYSANKPLANRSYSGVGDDSTTEMGPTYDLAECIRLMDIESLWAISVDRHCSLIMKEQPQVVGKNPDTVAYVKKRLVEMGYVADQPFNETLRAIVRDLITTSNAYVIKKRDPTRSSGRRTRKWGRELEPVSAIYTPDPSTMWVKQTATGLIQQYIQKLEEQRRTWPNHDVIHITYRRKNGLVFGTPIVVPVLEDIKALRKFELLVEHVGHKFAFPLLHWKVGTEKVPAEMWVDPVTQMEKPEVDVARDYLNEMAQEGFVVTSERHEIKLIGAEGEKLDLQPAIDHIELRVLAGLRLSEIDIGRGDTANRGTAKVISQNLIDECTEIQQVLTEILSFKLFDELVMEGGWDLIEDNRVTLFFPPIDKEEKRAQELHDLNLYLAGGITQDEFRLRIGLDPITPEQEQKLFLNTQLIPLAKATAAAKAANAAPSGDMGAMIQVAVQPRNQYGKLGAKSKHTKNDTDRILTLWRDGVEDVLQASVKKSDIRITLNQVVQNMMDDLETPIYQAWRDGWKQTLRDAGITPPMTLDRGNLNKFIQSFRTKDLHSVVRTAMIAGGFDPKTGLQAGLETDTSKARAAFESVEDMIQTRTVQAQQGARKLAQLEVAKLAGHGQIVAQTTDGKTEVVNPQDVAMIPVASNPRFKAFATTNG